MYWFICNLHIFQVNCHFSFVFSNILKFHDWKTGFPEVFQVLLNLEPINFAISSLYCHRGQYDNTMSSTWQVSTTDCLHFQPCAFIGWVVRHVLKFNWCSIDVQEIQDGLLQAPVWAIKSIYLARFYLKVSYNTECLIGVCTDTYVFYQSVLEKRDRLVSCIAKDVTS